jgi:hypothetical protein
MINIQDNEYDELIEILIPVIENYIVNYTGNFKNIAKSETTSALISNSLIILPIGYQTNLKEGQMIYLQGTALNDGVYTITDVTENVITVDVIYSVQNESCDAITIIPLNIPKELKLIVKDMVNYNIYKQNGTLKAYKAGSCSWQYNNDYPDFIKNELNKYCLWKIYSD